MEEDNMSIDIESAKLLAQQTGGKYSAEDVLNLAEYGTTTPMDFAPVEEEVEGVCICGIVNCPDAYVHTTSGY
jgi:hypothetical protein